MTRPGVIFILALLLFTGGIVLGVVCERLRLAELVGVVVNGRSR